MQMQKNGFRWMIGLVVAAALAVAGSPAAAQSFDYIFNVDEAQSNLTVEVVISGTVNDSDSDSSPVTGTIDATLTPPSGTFDMIRITAADLDLTQTLNFSLLAGFLTGTGENIGLNLAEPNAGSQTAVDPTGAFNQTGNTLTGEGTITASGLANETFDLTQETFVTGFQGTVIDDGTLTTLTIPVDLQLPTADLGGGNFADVSIFGDIVGTAETVPEPASLALIGAGGLLLLGRRRRAVAPVN